MPRKRPSSAVPPDARAALSAEGRRELADLDADLDRVHRRIDRGDVCPTFLEGADRRAPGAGALWLALDVGGAVLLPEVERAGARLGMDRAAVAVALAELRAGEHVADAPGGVVALPPGDVPF